MPRLLDIAPPESRSILERQRRQRRRAEQVPSFADQLTAATQVERMGAEIDRRLRRAGYRFDPDFTGIDDLPDETRRDLLEGVPTEQVEAFGEARSLRHAREIARQQRQIAESERRLAEAGVSGLGARVLAAVTDPLALAGEIATGGTVGAFSRAGRLGTMLRSGLVAGGTEAAIEGFVGSSDPTRGPADVLYAGAGGFLLGGAAGSLGRNFGRPYRVNRAKRELVDAARHIRKNIEFEDLQRTAGDEPAVLSERGKSWFRRQAERHVERRSLEDMIDAQGFEAEEADALKGWLRSEEFETLVEARATTPRTDSPEMAGRAEAETDAEKAARVGEAEQRAAEGGEEAAEPERIVGPVIVRQSDGEVFRGQTHAQIFEQHSDELTEADLAESDLFETTTGRIVGSEEAGRIARETQQVPTARRQREDQPLIAEMLRSAQETGFSEPAEQQGPDLLGGTGSRPDPDDLAGRSLVDEPTETGTAADPDTDAQGIVTDLEERGITARTEPADERERFVSEMAQRFGRRVVFADGGRLTAFFDSRRPRAIAINTKKGSNAQAMEDLFFHELTHSIERENPDVFQEIIRVLNDNPEMKQAAIRQYIRQGNPALARRVRASERLQDSEAAAVVIQQASKRREFWSELRKSMPAEAWNRIRRKVAEIIIRMREFASTFGLPDAQRRAVNRRLAQLIESTAEQEVDFTQAGRPRFDPSMSAEEFAGLFMGPRKGRDFATVNLEGNQVPDVPFERAVFDRWQALQEFGQRQAREATEGEQRAPDLLGGMDPGAAPRLQAGDFEARLQDDPVRFGRARVSIVGLVGRSESRMLRMAGNAYMPDPLPKATDRPQHTDALSWADRKRRAMNGAWLVFTKNRFERWAQRRGASKIQQKLGTREWDEFQEQVGRGVRRPPGSYTSDPDLNEAIEFTRRYAEDLLGIGQRHNVRGLEDVQPGEQFFWRLWSRPALDRWESEVGTDELARVLKEAMRRGSGPDTPDDLLQVAARAMLKSIRRVRDFTDMDQAMMLRGKRPDLLREALRAEGLDEEQVNRLVELVNPPAEQAPITSRAKHRVSLDETARIGVTRRDGTRTELGIEDLLNNNAAEVVEIATRQMLGAAAESEVFRAFSKESGRTVQSYRDLRSLIEEDMVEAGIAKRKRDADLERLDTVHKAVAGIPLGRDTVAADVMRGARNFMHVTTAGQFGIMQVPEAARIVSTTGFRAMIDAMPALSRIFRRAQDGQLTDDFLREAEGLGYGLDYVNSIVHSRIDEQDAAAEMAGTGIDRLLRRGARASMVLGGLTPIMTAQQRLAVSAMVNRFAQWGLTGRKLGKRRLLGIGLDERQADAIARQVRNHATTEQGLVGTRVQRLNLDRWADQEAAANLVRALDRFSRRAIQESDVGSLSKWMTTDAGRLITQYRTFQFQAWEKGLLYNLSMMDLRVFTELTTAMMTAGILYAAQQHVLAAGRGDRREFLRERLSPGNIARIAFQRAGFSSFVPEGVDSIARLMGREGSLFTGRVSQLSTLDAFGNPVLDAADDALGLVREVAGSVQGLEQFTADDFRRSKSLIPFSRVLGVSNVLDALGSELPEE